MGSKFICLGSDTYEVNTEIVIPFNIAITVIPPEFDDLTYSRIADYCNIKSEE